MMNLYHEAREIAQEAIKECGYNESALQDYIWQSCDSHRIAFVYHEGITFCAEQDTTRGEELLEGGGGIIQEDDSFGAIACRIAYATLYVAVVEALDEILEEQAASHWKGEK